MENGGTVEQGTARQGGPKSEADEGRSGWGGGGLPPLNQLSSITNHTSGDATFLNCAIECPCVARYV